MQITNFTPPAGACTTPKATAGTSVDAPAKVEVVFAGGAKSPDFSRITPRQLQAFLDDRLMSGYIDGPDGLYCSTLGGSIPGEWYTECPDMPVDLTATINSMTGFARVHDFSKLVSLYEGLSNWMRMIEVQPTHISVMA